MRLLATTLILAALGTATASAAPRPQASDAKGEAQLAKLLAGRVAGTPSTCISLHGSEDSQVIDHTAIVYRDGARLWVNRPTGGLDTLDDDSILVTRLYTSQLCNVDIVHLVDRFSRFPRGFVSLGEFVPYTKPRS